MSATQPCQFLNPEAYLDWEEKQPEKYEFFKGEAYAMVGARDAHVTVAGNVFALLKAHLRGTPCRAYISDMKLQVEAADAFFYPDVFVTCDPRDRLSERYKSYPVLIVEVLSESTAAFDRGAKFAAYRKLESFKEYLLIDPDAFTAELFRRNAEGLWVLYPLEGEGELELASVGLRITWDAVFEDVLPAARTQG